MSDIANKSPGNSRRGLVWYVKFVFACYAASLGLSLLAVVVSLPFKGFALASWWFEPAGGLAMFAIAVAVSPAFIGGFGEWSWSNNSFQRTPVHRLRFVQALRRRRR